MTTSNPDGPSPVTEQHSCRGFSWTNPAHVLAFGLGAGKAPYAPGTAGSLLALPLCLLLIDLLLWQYLLAVIVVLCVGIYVSKVTADALGVHDHPGIVIDEVAGMLVSCIALPQGWPWLVLAFVLFRLFDIWKPFPIGLLDKKLKGGTGIMLDDVVAGIYTMLILQVCHILWRTL